MRIEMTKRMNKIVRGKGNKTAKKICCAVLAAVIVIMGFPLDWTRNSEGIVYADSMKYMIGNSTYTYYVTSNNTVTITGYEGTDTKINIPERIEGKEVTGIGAATFYQGSNLVEIVIPKSVKEIEPFGIGLFSVFDGCTYLKAIYVEEGNQYYKSINGVLYRYKYDYDRTDGMTMLCYPKNKKDSIFTIPKDVKYIYGGAFDGPSNLKQINVEEGNLYYKSVDGVLFDIKQAKLVCYPSNKDNDVYVVPGEVHSIGWYAFSDCKNLEKIIISDGVNYIDGGGINHCEKLTEITIPKSLEWNNGAFCQGCVSLREINVEEGNPHYKLIDGILFSADGTEIVRYLPDKDNDSYEIPQGVQYIGYGAFDSSTNLRKLIIPNSVVEAGAGAFDGCIGLTICGKKNSYAQMCAGYNNIPFCVIEDSLGDVNGDGEFDIKDSALIKSHLAGWETEMDEQSADLDGDGAVTIKDSALIKRQLAGWTVE